MNKFFTRTILSYFLSILLCLFALLSQWTKNALLRPTIANAESSPIYTPASGDYACILSDEVFFYSSADERKGVFLLPKSYYVRLIEYRSDFCKVEYQRNESDAQRLVGYVKTKELTFVNYVPARPYLYYVFDVTYTIENAEPNDSSFLTQITVSCVYYGDYRVGSETYCYVLRGEEFGYIPKPFGLSYDENTEYNDYLSTLIPPTTEQPPEATLESDVSPMQAAILIVICLLVPVLAALVLKPPRRPVYEMEE